MSYAAALPSKVMNSRDLMTHRLTSIAVRSCQQNIIAQRWSPCAEMPDAASRLTARSRGPVRVKYGHRAVGVATYQVPPKADEIAAAHSFGANRPHHYDPGSPPNIRREALSNSTSTAPTPKLRTAPVPGMPSMWPALSARRRSITFPSLQTSVASARP